MPYFSVKERREIGSSSNRMWSQRKVFVCLLFCLFLLMGNFKRIPQFVWEESSREGEPDNIAEKKGQ